MNKLINALICALMVIAAAVGITIAAGGNAWWMIVLYWAVLTVKNACDVINARGKK